MNEVNKEIVNDQMVNLILIIASFTAHFVQDKQSALFTEPQRSEGELVYRTPDYLRWEYTSPQPLVWEIDGDKGNVNKQITGLLMLIKQCVKGDFGAAEKSFTVQQNGHSVVLTPKKRELQRLFRQIEIELNPQTDIADRVVIHEANGDDTTIRFKQVTML